MLMRLKCRVFAEVLGLSLIIFFAAFASYAGAAVKEMPFLYVETTPAVSFDPGEQLTIKVRLTKADGVTPLPGRKITLSLNGENAHRQTAVTGADGWGTAQMSLANKLDSSCCTLGKRDYPNPYPLIATFPGDSSYARQEVIGMVGMRGSTGQKTKIEYSPPPTVVSGGRLQVGSAVAKLAGSGAVVGNVQVCVDKYCGDFYSSSPSVDVTKLPRGSYAATLFYHGDGSAHYSAVYATFGIFINNGIPQEERPTKGLYRGWDWSNAKPTDTKDITGRPMSFDGLDVMFWKDFYTATERIANQIIQTPIKITLADGSQRYKRYIPGISPIGFGETPFNTAPSKYSFKKIPLPNCPSASCPSTICGIPKEMPDFMDPAWQDAFRTELLAIADWWKNHPEYQDIIVAVRVGGGYDGEWGNGPDKGGCARGSMEQYYQANYGKTYDQFKGFWDELRRKAIGWAAEASARSQLPGGKRLYYIHEDRPQYMGKIAEPTVGFKWNAVDVMGIQIYTPPICAAPCLEQSIGYYGKISPNHFGGLETRYGYYGYGQWPWQPAGARATGAYWNSLLALEAGVDFFDFHGNYWEGYQYLAGLDLFMMNHLQNGCDNVKDGLVAFREVANPYRKDAPACGEYTTPQCKAGDPGYNANGLTLNYGDVDICLYVPRIPGVQLEPVRNDYYRGEVDGPTTGQRTFTKAKAQHYINGGRGPDYHSRKLVSQFAYVDIDEGITSRMGNKWEIKVVYYDGHPGETDTFSLDYYSTDGSLKSLTVNKQGTEIFKEVIWVVADLRTDNPFPEALADLRLNNRGDGPDIFHSVAVKAITDGAEGAPIPPQNFSVTLE